MKKLSLFQILVASSLFAGSINLYSYSQQVIEDIQDSQAIESLDNEVVNELSKTDLGKNALQRIAKDEFNLQVSFNSVRNFIRKIQNEINRLMKDKQVREDVIARLAVELADAKTNLEKAQARFFAKYGRKSRLQSIIAQELDNASIALKNLNAQATKIFEASMQGSNNKQSGMVNSTIENQSLSTELENNMMPEEVVDVVEVSEGLEPRPMVIVEETDNVQTQERLA